MKGYRKLRIKPGRPEVAAREKERREEREFILAMINAQKQGPGVSQTSGAAPAEAVELQKEDDTQ